MGDGWMFGVRERLAVVRCGRAVGGPASCAAAPMGGPRGAEKGESLRDAFLLPCDPFPASVAPRRLALRCLMKTDGFQQEHPERFSVRMEFANFVPRGPTQDAT